MRGKHNKLGEGERKVRLGQDSLPNIAMSVAEMSGNNIRCFTRTQSKRLAGACTIKPFTAVIYVFS